MNKQTTLAEGLNPVGTELIGKIVYFEAYKAVKVKESCKELGRLINGAYYNLIPGTVVHATSTNVGIEAAGGLYNRRMADIVEPEDLDHWMHRNPGKLVMRGDQ